MRESMYADRSSYANDERVYMYCPNTDEQVCTCDVTDLRFQVVAERVPTAPANAERLLWEQLRGGEDLFVRYDSGEGWRPYYFGGGWSTTRPLSHEVYPSAEAVLKDIFG